MIAQRGQHRVGLFDMNEQWPHNRKSLWASLRPGQRAAVIVGVPIIKMMMMTVVWLVDESNVPTIVRGVVLFVSFFMVPLVYVRGIGIFIAVLFEMMIRRK